MLELKEIEKMDQKGLEIFAEKKSEEILLKINEVSERIDDAKELAEDAKDIKAKWYNKNKVARQRSEATANALVKTNEAIAEMNTLIQESINFTKYSAQFSAVIHKTMARMVANGFKDANGEIVQLNENGTEFANMIITEAEDFTNKQLEVERLQRKQEERMNNLQNHSDSRDDAIELALSLLEKESNKKDIELENLVKSKTNQILSKSDLNDERHDMEIRELQQLVSELMKTVNKIKWGKILFFRILSIASFVIAITSLILQFI